MSGSDSMALLAQRLQALSEDGIKINPATANPGERRARGKRPVAAGGCRLACRRRFGGSCAGSLTFGGSCVGLRGGGALQAARPV